MWPWLKAENRAEATKTRRGSIGQQDGSDRLEIDSQPGRYRPVGSAVPCSTDIGLNEMQVSASARVGAKAKNLQDRKRWCDRRKPNRRVSARFTGGKYRSRVWISLFTTHLGQWSQANRRPDPLGTKLIEHAAGFNPCKSGPSPLMNRAARRLGHPASIPRAIMSRSPEALALGPAVISFRRRYHCPSFGCLLNRSRDCTRSRVPPLIASALC